MIVIKNTTARRILRAVLPFVLIPAIVILGIFAVESQYHAFVSFFVAVCSLLLFLCGFEKKKIGSRRLVIVAVMIALSVVGRMFPVIKPVTAFAVISGMFLGAEAGFLVGSFSALISNFYFGQGPWTPFQMLGWGLVGLAAGALAKPLKKSRVFLLIFGVLSGAVFSAIMDVWTVMWYNEGFDVSLYLSAVLTALPHTALYAASNFIFLFFLAKPFGEKLERIKIKYGV